MAVWYTNYKNIKPIIQPVESFLLPSLMMNPLPALNCVEAADASELIIIIIMYAIPHINIYSEPFQK